MTKQWIVAANAYHAHIYEATAKGKRLIPSSMRLIQTLHHPASLKKRQELSSDRPGHYKTRESTRGAYSQHLDVKEKEKINFAKDIIEVLEKGFNSHHYQQLILFAAPHFYGLLKSALSDQLIKHLHSVIEKDYTSATIHELEAACLIKPTITKS